MTEQLWLELELAFRPHEDQLRANFRRAKAVESRLGMHDPCGAGFFGGMVVGLLFVFAGPEMACVVLVAAAISMVSCWFKGWRLPEPYWAREL
jgi:hypothetical protein